MLIDKQKLIFCILPKGVALEVVKQLKEIHGIMSSNISNARGVGKITPLAYRGISGQSEKEILSIVVSANQADEIFEFVYHEAHIDQPHGGIMYLHALHETTEYSLPEVAEEK
jgi:hypothetical protein